MMSPEAFLRAVRADPAGEPMTKLATIASGYVSGRPAVRFDGEATDTTKTYPYLLSYTPQANDRVLLVRSGSTWVIIGEVV